MLGGKRSGGDARKGAVHRRIARAPRIQPFKALLADWGVPTDLPPPRHALHDAVAEDDRTQDGPLEYAHLRSLVNITRGCEKFCTYCIVPYTRGPLESIEPEEIESQVRREIRCGAKEITLLGQNVNSYLSRRRTEFRAICCAASVASKDSSGSRFSPRIRKTSVEKSWTRLREVPNVAPRLHLPMQSASNSVLKAMARLYTIEEYLEKIAYFRERLPALGAHHRSSSAGIRAKPREIFSRHSNSCERGTFEYAFIFAYSPRSGTPAATMTPQVESPERLRRLQAVNTAQHELAHASTNRSSARPCACSRRARRRKTRSAWPARAATTSP